MLISANWKTKTIYNIDAHGKRKGSFHIALFCGIAYLAACIGDEAGSKVQSITTHRANSTLASTDILLKTDNGIVLYKNQPLNGTIIAKSASGQNRSSTAYPDGLQERKEMVYFANGNTESIRFYKHGQKDSVHRGWWENGNQRFAYHFKNEVYDGDFREWYPGGQNGKLIHYKNSVELDGKGWRENGKLFVNYVMKKGRRYGLVNEQLCYSLNKERGKYVKE